jgi:hypothetical protein
MTFGEVEKHLVLGAGWVERFESGLAEPSLGTLAALLDTYGSNLPTFFAELDLGDTRVVLDRLLTATEDGTDLVLHFPMGPFPATVCVPNATLDEFNDVLSVLRDRLALENKREAIVACFLKAAEAWPQANPSDLWYFFISHAYQDDYNHPATEAGRDWAQSWKRAGGWALEAVFVAHYKAHLEQNGVLLDMPTDPHLKTGYLRSMGVTDAAAAAKSDVLVLGWRDNAWEPFGVVHVKASFAERRTDDVPLSMQLIARGYASPFVTMDCKAAPSATPFNRGELGPVQGADAVISAKRLDFEDDRKFDACFVYNTNTLPTPVRQAAAARIHVCDFNDPDDVFSRHLIRKWHDRQGI